MANTSMTEKIPLLPVKSTAFSHVGYNPATNELDIKWANGKIWRYFGVKPETYARLQTAPSAGREFMASIRGEHQQKLMTGECPACGDGPGWIGETCQDCGTEKYGDPGPYTKKR